MGDFVDRGFYSVETFLLLLALKVRSFNSVKGTLKTCRATCVECLGALGSLRTWQLLSLSLP
jgi:hypothetical protein